MKILEISEIEHKLLKVGDSEHSRRYDGYEIITEDGAIYLLISSYQSCCESFGYACTEDTLSDFFGATILDFEVVDSERAVSTNKLMNHEIYDMREVYDGDIMFLTVNTDKGVLQFSVYNEHNGYYSHEAHVVVNNKVIVDTCL